MQIYFFAEKQRGAQMSTPISKFYLYG